MELARWLNGSFSGVKPPILDGGQVSANSDQSARRLLKRTAYLNYYTGGENSKCLTSRPLLVPGSRFLHFGRERFMKVIKSMVFGLVVAGISACAPVSSKRFTVDRQSIAKPIVVGNITVAPFKEAPFVDDNCRAAGKITPPDRATFESYIQQALADEIKRVRLADEKTPKTALFGEVKVLTFTSTSTFSDAWWIIKIKVTSSNGQAIEVGEKYDFNTSFGAYKACQEAADAYVPAVKKTVAKMVNSPDFLPLLAP
jgi:hypothetical protein